MAFNDLNSNRHTFSDLMISLHRWRQLSQTFIFLYSPNWNKTNSCTKALHSKNQVKMSEKFYILRFENMHIRYALYSLYCYLFWLILVNSSSVHITELKSEPKILYKCKKKVFRVHKFHFQFWISTETSSKVPYNIINFNCIRNTKCWILFS